MMKRCLAWIHFFLFIGFFQKIYAQDPSLQRHQLYMGPKWSYVERIRHLGTKQQGHVWGLEGGYDRLKRYGWYWGAQADYLEGNLRGHSRFAGKLRSRFLTSFIEGRFGYTFQQKENWQLAFTPFLGVGYNLEKNRFLHPSPLKVRFKTDFAYATVGFLSWIHIAERVELGANFKIRIPFEPKCRVTHDEENDPVTQKIGERLQYRLDLPITYRLDCGGRFAIILKPFYEYRHYGSRVNYPFDFFKTRYRFWGTSLELQYRF